MEWDIGILILLWRRQYGMTQTELSRRTGIMQSYISSIEQGSVDPRWSTVVRLVDGFDDMSLELFFSGPLRQHKYREFLCEDDVLSFTSEHMREDRNINFH